MGYLAEELKAKADSLLKEMDPPLEKIEETARQLKQDKTAERLQQVRKSLAEDTFNLMVVGRFKNGKSTFLNALLGKRTRPVPELGDSDGPLPMDDLPATATLTRINYSDGVRVRVWDFEGKVQSWSLQKYLKEATVKVDPEETRLFFQNIREFELDYPAELCQAKVTLLDSPGTDDDPRRTEITRQALRKCDAAFVVFRSDVIAGESERTFVNVEMVSEGLTSYFMVVNMWGGREADPRFRTFIWNRLVHEMLGGEKYQGQDFTAKNIYFVDCKKALEGVYSDNRQLVRESGLELLEQRLTKFLEGDKRKIHLQRHLEPALRLTPKLEESAQRQLASLRQEQQEFQRNYEAIQPKLQEIYRRRDRLPDILEQYRKEAEHEILISHEHFVAHLPDALKAEIANYTLPSLDPDVNPDILNKLKTPFIQKRLGKEVAEAIQKITTAKIKEWQEQEINKCLQPVLERMMDDIRKQVALIEQGMEEIGLTLSGWQAHAPETQIKQTSNLERAGWILAGFFTGNLEVGVMGSAGGWKGAAKGLATEVGVLTGLLLLGASVTVALPVAIIAGIGMTVMHLVGGADKQVRAIKDKLLEVTIWGDPKENTPSLRQQLDDLKPQLRERVKNYFTKLEDGFIKAVDSAISVQEQEIRQLLENNNKSIQEKEAKKTEIEHHLQIIGQNSKLIEEALARVQQL